MISKETLNQIKKLIEEEKRSEARCGCLQQEGCGCSVADFNDGLDIALTIIEPWVIND